MELKHLQSFIAVAEQLSFVRAAQRLHISQPALTAHIQQLEESVGAQLLLRNKRSVRLTEAGADFLEAARDILHRVKRAVDQAQESARGETGRLRIGFVSSAALEIVPPLAVAYRKRFPGVQLDLMNWRTSDQLRQLADKELDIGFARMPAQHKGLSFARIHREPLVMVLSKQHPLARKKDLHLADLRDQHFILYGRRWAPGFFDQILDLCQQQGFTPNILQETAEMYTAVAIVAAGLDVSILPRSVVAAQRRGIVVRELKYREAFSEIAIVTRDEPASVLVRNFVKLAKSMAKTKPEATAMRLLTR
ncbi:LysR family transcriptional regulator [Granulicella cerasi]|uniref:LysR family transcriptional regulator n=1 Tax=Granulicella cerasi TaxID=741063 RepID=A0ABW1Z5E1_9BACT|nr:LysR family transcriptional regulator [Granulicella cerasi]